jgi:hypothetical protein
MENTDIVRLLVKLGADVNAVDSSGLVRIFIVLIVFTPEPTGKRPQDCFKTPQGRQR